MIRRFHLLRRGIGLCAVAAALLFSSCGPSTVRVAGTIATSLDVENRFYKGARSSTPERPRTDLGPLNGAEVRLASSDMKWSDIRRTDTEGRFELSMPLGKGSSKESVILIIQMAGYKAVRFDIPIADIERLDVAGGPRYFLEFWLPPLEPTS